MTSVLDTPVFSVSVPEKGACKGHVQFQLKSLRPDDIALAGFCANICTIILFQKLEAQGTNIIITLEKETGRIDILSRYENDGMNLLWQPKPVDAAQLDAAQERIRNKTFFIGKESKKDSKEESAPAKTDSAPTAANQTTQSTSRTTPMPDAPPSSQDDLSEQEEDHLIKQLHRIP